MTFRNGTDARQASVETPDADTASLTDTSINPATDYLNRFNEAVMLLDMLSNCPEFRDDFLAWEPMNYREHFRLSHFKTRDLAITADDQADPNVRNTLDTLAVTMTIVLEATRAAMDDVDRRPETVATLAGNAID
jgi:hypothetical protein